MGDGKALQSATSHNLGDHFARAYNVVFLDESNERQFAWTTSWGLSTRVIGAMIMVHGDQQGLILPPRVAPFQVVIVPIWRKDAEKGDVLAAVDRVSGILKQAGVRVKIDASEERSVGWKFNEWELKGVPLRMEIGPRDVQNNSVVLVRRDNRAKEFVSVDDVARRVPELLEQLQKDLYQRAVDFRESHTYRVANFDELKEAVEKGGFADAFWCGGADCEQTIKDETRATNRCIPLDQPGDTGPCVVCGKPSDTHALFAKAY
jgi:prolyl-tRNA synthetase